MGGRVGLSLEQDYILVNKIKIKARLVVTFKAIRAAMIFRMMSENVEPYVPERGVIRGCVDRGCVDRGCVDRGCVGRGLGSDKRVC